MKALKRAEADTARKAVHREQEEEKSRDSGGTGGFPCSHSDCNRKFITDGGLEKHENSNNRRGPERATKRLQVERTFSLAGLNAAWFSVKRLSLENDSETLVREATMIDAVDAHAQMLDDGILTVLTQSDTLAVAVRRIIHGGAPPTQFVMPFSQGWARKAPPKKPCSK